MKLRYDPTLPSEGDNSSHVSLRYLSRLFEISIPAIRRYLNAEGVKIEAAPIKGYLVDRQDAIAAIEKRNIPPDGTILAEDFVIRHPSYGIFQIRSILTHRRLRSFMAGNRLYFYEREMIEYLNAKADPRPSIRDSVEGHTVATGISNSLVRKAVRFHELSSGRGGPIVMSRKQFVSMIKTYLNHLGWPGSPLYEHAVHCHLTVSESRSGRAVFKKKTLSPPSWRKFCAEKLLENGSYAD